MSDAAPDTAIHPSSPRLTPILAAVIYVLLCGGACALLWASSITLATRGGEVKTAQHVLNLLRQRGQGAASGLDTYGLQAADSIASGDKPIVSAAELQARVGSVILNARGTVLSSQADVSEPRGSFEDLTLTVECELMQPDLQPILYGIESSAPFIFIRKVTVHAQDATRQSSEAPRMRVSMLLTTTWRARP
jgi:hypothetical protein